jgi:hypothetical protein
LFLEDALVPVNPIVEALVCRLDDNLREAFEERAGVMQFEAGQERELAEALALLDVMRMHPLAVSGAHVLRAVVKGTPVLVLTTDPGAARARLATLGATGAAPWDLAMALHQLGDTAYLTALEPAAKSEENDVSAMKDFGLPPSTNHMENS